MTPRFDEFDKELREALASEALPPAGFTDRVMARVAETPQQKKAPAPYRRWLVSAAACLVVAAALIPLLRGGGLGSKESSDMAAADNGGTDQQMMQSAPPASGAPDENASQNISQQKNGADTAEDSRTGSADIPADGNGRLDDTGNTDTASKAPRHDTEYAAAPSSAMDDALTRAADALAAQGYILTVTAREDDRVQVTLTDDTGAPADAALAAAMEAEGFAAADGWYTYEEDTNP